MARCDAEADCDAGFRMICSGGQCQCNPGDLFLEWPKYGCFSKVHMFGQCEVSGQCVAMNANTYCNPDNGRCTCSPNYFYNGRECRIRYDGTNLKAQEVYKAAVVAAACFIVAVVGIFVACIVRRSFCRRDQNLQPTDPNRESDIFSISDEIAALRAVDKPPSYEEVLQIERTFYGIPPPEYTAARSISSLEVFRSPVPICPPGNAETFNIPYNPAFLPPPPPMESDIIPQTTSSKNQQSEPSTSGSSPMNFIASADVISPPVNPGESTPIEVTRVNHGAPNHHPGEHSPIGVSRVNHGAPSYHPEEHTPIEVPYGAPSYQPEEYSAIEVPLVHHDASSHHPTPSPYISSTPPPRLHRLYQTLPQGNYSLSLPGSPNLGSSHIRVLNLPDTRRMELLKQNSSSGSTSQTLEVSIESLPRDNAVSDGDSRSGGCSSGNGQCQSQVAYDNLGFVSDLHE